MAARTVEDLKPNPKNPRKITSAKLEQLKKAMLEFGDLGGFVFNRTTGHLVGGHQRQRALDPKAKVTIVDSYPRPTKSGTVAEGFVVLSGERFRYREVAWDEPREKAATIAANKSAGEWDMPILGEWLVDLDDFGFDLDNTMFDELERKKILGKDEPKESNGKKSRSASDDVKSVQLTFTDENHAEFLTLLEFFQKEMQVDSVTDTILEVLRAGRKAYG